MKPLAGTKRPFRVLNGQVNNHRAGATNTLGTAIKTVNNQTTMGKPEPQSGETIELTFGAAFTLAKKSGKQPPYNGLGAYLRNGDFLYCRPDGQFVLQTARKAVAA